MSTHSAFRELLEACRRRPPRVAIVLGSGLGNLAAQVDCEHAVPFGELPDMEAPTVDGHQGELRSGSWGGRRVLVFVGRLHFYEGHASRRIEQSIITAHTLSAEVLLLTNAAGGIRDDLSPGSLMPIQDHIDWTRPWPAREKE